MASLTQRLKTYIEIDEQNKDLIYNALFVNKQSVMIGNNFLLETDYSDRLTLIIKYKNSITTVTFAEFLMYVEVERNEINYEFELKYDATPEWLFQLSTIHDLGFIEHKYMKYLNKLHELYSVEYD